MTQGDKSNAPFEDAERRRLGQKLRQAREYLGLSQDEVARHLRIPRTALTNIESGQRKIDALELKKLAALYHQTVTYFTTDDEETTDLPADVSHLARTAAKLSVRDREELGKFAEYLRSRSELRSKR